eukprot:6204308-Pleurochrysis_carterae.AAC.2
MLTSCAPASAPPEQSVCKGLAPRIPPSTQPPSPPPPPPRPQDSWQLAPPRPGPRDSLLLPPPPAPPAVARVTPGGAIVSRGMAAIRKSPTGSWRLHTERPRAAMAAQTASALSARDTFSWQSTTTTTSRSSARS